MPAPPKAFPFPNKAGFSSVKRILAGDHATKESMMMIKRSLLTLSVLLAIFPMRRAAALPTDFDRVTVLSGLNFPQCMRFAPDGRIFLGLHKGDIAIVKNGALLPKPFASVSVNVNQ